MVSAGTKRKRRERENRIAAALEDSRAKAAAEKRALGTEVHENIPDIELFHEDRGGESKSVVRENLRAQAAEEIRARKRARRQAPKERRSEAALRPNPNVKAYDLSRSHRGKKKKGVASVEAGILRKRKFDKPRGHAGNVSEDIRVSKMHVDGREDLWTSEISEKVRSEIGVNRRRIVEKTQSAHRSAAQVICPRDGLSMNPCYSDHQDKLGEALATIVKGDDDIKFAKDKMKYDPAILLESKEGEIADTGMKGDVTDDEVESDGGEEEYQFIIKPVAERKTRSQRHKEARKREMARNIEKKKTNQQREVDFTNIADVTEEAQEIAEKLNGDAKLKRLEEDPQPEPPMDHPVLERIAGQTVRKESTLEPVVLSSELSKSMRTVKMPLANPLVRDRFLSFERRGLIAPPKVLPKEVWRMNQAKRQEEMRDKRKRKGRGSRSNLTFWRNGKRVIQ